MGPHLSSEDRQGRRCPMWDLNFLHLRKILHICDIFLLVGHCAGVFWLLTISAPPTLLNVMFSLYLQVWNSCSARVQVLRGSCTICSFSLSVSMGGGKLSIFLLSHLPLSQERCF